MGFLRIISCTRNVIVVFIVPDTRTMVTIKFSIVVIYTSANRYQSASNSSIKTCAFDGVSYASIKMISVPKETQIRPVRKIDTSMIHVGFSSLGSQE